MKIKPVKAWAWAISRLDKYGVPSGEWLLCQWADASTDAIKIDRPSPEAKLIRVEIRPVPKRRKKAKP